MKAVLLMATMAAASNGVMFPSLQGRNLSGAEVTVPGSYPGKVLMVCMGFKRESQYEVEPWARLAGNAFGKDPRFWVLEMPMYSGAARVFRPFIDRGMARATPPQLHGNVVTSTDVDEVMEGLSLGNREQAAMALVAPDGSVRFLARGVPTPESEAAFQRALATLRTELDGKP
jgi:hypothetical protein